MFQKLFLCIALATIFATASGYTTFSVRDIRDVNALLGAGGELASLNYLPPVGDAPKGADSDVCIR